MEVKHLSPVDLKSCIVDSGIFYKNVYAKLRSGYRPVNFFLHTADNAEKFLIMILSNDISFISSASNSVFEILASKVVGDSFDSFTVDFPGFWNFEREIYENSGVYPKNHPDIKPVRFINSPDNLQFKNPPIGDMKFFKMTGDEVHEVAVGPVHAGVIEPGHFRFQCSGENVYNLEISLGYQHRGVEPRLKGRLNSKFLHYIEAIAGDTSIGHGLSHVNLIESLSENNIAISRNIQSIRAIALELERLANHTGDLGAIANDVGFLPTASFCGRIRGDFLNLTAEICGNRFGRTLLNYGGINYNVPYSKIKTMKSKLNSAFADLKNAADLMFASQTVLDRLEHTGNLPVKHALDLGIYGMAGRASGVAIDSRVNHAFGAFVDNAINIQSLFTGDVFARAMIRYKEAEESYRFIIDEFDAFIANANDISKNFISSENIELQKNKIAVSLCEGWRGEVCHVIITNENGEISQYKVKDISFNNWKGLSMVLRNQIISDFPLCNKSFNLSYCGHDL